jgi:hypothetical protein
LLWGAHLDVDRINAKRSGSDDNRSSPNAWIRMTPAFLRRNVLSVNLNGLFPIAESDFMGVQATVAQKDCVVALSG